MNYPKCFQNVQTQRKFKTSKTSNINVSDFFHVPLIPTCIQLGLNTPTAHLHTLSKSMLTGMLQTAIYRQQKFSDSTIRGCVKMQVVSAGVCGWKVAGLNPQTHEGKPSCSPQSLCQCVFLVNQLA